MVKKALTKYFLMLSVSTATMPAIAETVSGIGAQRCVEFNFRIENNDKVVVDSYMNWALGFISGFNWSNSRGHDLAIDPGTLGYWITNYCGSNSDKYFHDAVRALIENNQ